MEEQLVAVAPTTAATDANTWMENMESLLLLHLTERMRLRPAERAAADLLDEDMTAGAPSSASSSPAVRKAKKGRYTK